MGLLKNRRGSSLVFLGFSVIVFLISYGVMFMVVPIVLGVFFSIDVPIADPAWQTTMDETEVVIRWIVPLVPTVGLSMFVIKVLMVSSAKGRD